MRKSDLHYKTKNIAYAFIVKSCRQLKSVLELCSRQEGEDGAIIARSMFEAWLTVAFLIRNNLPAPHEKMPTGYDLNHEFRANLYASHILLQDLRHSVLLDGIENFKVLVNLKLPKDEQELIDEIGEQSAR